MKNKATTVNILKYSGLALVIILLLLICLPFVFQKKIAEAVKQGINDQLTAKVAFTDYGLSLFRSFPDFSLSLENLSVAGTGDFEGDTLLAVDNIYLSLDLFSVIKGRPYKIKKIGLKNPGIYLKALANGKVNWDISKPSADTLAKEEAETGALRLSIEKFQVSRGKLVYEDLAGNMKASLEKMDMTLKADIEGDLSRMTVKAKVESAGFAYGGIEYLKRVKTELKADIAADLAKFRFTFKDNVLSMNELTLSFDGWFAMPGENMEMDLTFASGKNEFRHFLSLVPAVYSKDFSSVETKGSLAFNGFVKGTYNDSRMPAFAIKLLVADAMFRYPDLPAAVENIAIDASISNKDGVPDNTVILIKKLHADVANNPIDLGLQLSTPVSDPAIKAWIKGKLDLSDVGKFYPLDPADQMKGLLTANIDLDGRMSSIEQARYEEFKASGSLQVQGMNYKTKDFPSGIDIRQLQLLFSPQFVEMPVAELQIGRSDVKASGKLNNLLAYALKDETLVGSFSSQSVLVDLNEFMSDSGEETAADTGSLTVIRIPANIDFTATAGIQKLLYDNMEMNRVSGKLRISDQKIALDPLSMEMLGGSFLVTGTYNSKEEKPGVDFTLDVSRIDIPLAYKTFNTVQKLAPIAEKCSGKVSVKMAFNAMLNENMGLLTESLSGKGNLKTEGLEVRDFMPMNKLADALKIDKFRKMALEDASLSIAIDNGRLAVEPFPIKADNITATLGGWNAIDGQISWDAALEIPREMFGGQANAVLDGLVKKAGSQGVKFEPGSTVVVGAKITGTVSDPKVSTDLKRSLNSAVEDLKQQAVQQVKEIVQEKVTQLKEDLGAKAKQIIADAEKQAQRLRDEAKNAGEALISEADKQGQELVKKAGNPVAKVAARETAKQLVKTARSKSDKLRQEADVQANKLLEDAKKEAAKLQ